MPRPRKPTKILQLNGAFKTNPNRAKAREGEPTDNEPLGDPPVHLGATERETWFEIQSQLVEGVALASDRIAFEGLVMLVAKQRREGLQGPELVARDRLLTKFGMTPSDRSRVSVPKSAGRVNPFEALGA